MYIITYFVCDSALEGKSIGIIYFTLDGCIYFEAGFRACPALPSLAIMPGTHYRTVQCE